jgi:hypothetical protein
MLAHLAGRGNRRPVSAEATTADRADFTRSATAYGIAPTLFSATDVTSDLTIPLTAQHARSVKRWGRTANTIPEKAKPDGRPYSGRIVHSKRNEMRHTRYLLSSSRYQRLRRR